MTVLCRGRDLIGGDVKDVETLCGCPAIRNDGIVETRDSEYRPRDYGMRWTCPNRDGLDQNQVPMLCKMPSIFDDSVQVEIEVWLVRDAHEDIGSSANYLMSRVPHGLIAGRSLARI